MAEAIATLSLVANVIQVITFARDVVTTYYSLSENHSPEPNLASNIAHLSALTTKLQDESSQYDPVSTSTGDEPDDSQLQARNRLKSIASDLVRDTTELRHQLQKVTTPPTSGSLHRSKTALKYMFLYRKKIDTLKKKVDDTQMILNSDLLIRICSSDQANRICADAKFAELDDSLRTFIDKWSKGERTISQLVRTEAQATRAHITSESEQTRERIDLLNKDAETEKRQRELEETRKRLLLTLWFPEMNARENNIEEASEETTNWILSDTLQDEDGNEVECRFKTWLQSDQPIFYISGKAGSGKSTLSKFLIRDQRTIEYLRTWHSQVQVLRFFFFELGTNSLQKNRLGCLRALIHQIIDRKFVQLDQLLKTRPELGNKLSEHDWSLKDLNDTLFECIRLSSSAFCIFLDGLDEVGIDEKRHVVRFVQELGDMPNVKVCASTRPENYFREQLEIHPTIRLQDLTRPAIKAYIQRTISEHKHGFDTTAGVYMFLVDEIISKSDGVFLWVAMALKSLLRGFQNGDTWDVLRQRIRELSPGLNGLFKQMWDRQSADYELYREESAGLFWFAICVCRLLSTHLTTSLFILGTCPHLRHELQAIIGDHDPNDSPIRLDHLRIHRKFEEWLFPRSAGLLQVSVRKDSEICLTQNKVEFIHRSAKEFLQRTNDGLQILQYDHRTPREKIISVSRALTLDSYAVSLFGVSVPEHNPHLLARLKLCATIDIALGLNELKDRMAVVDQQWLPPSYPDQELIQSAAASRDLSLLTYFQDVHNSFSQQQKNDVLLYICDSLRYMIYSIILTEQLEILSEETQLNFDYHYIITEFSRRQILILEFLLDMGSDPKTRVNYFPLYSPGPYIYHFQLNMATLYQIFVITSVRNSLYNAILYEIPHINKGKLSLKGEYVSHMIQLLKLFERHGTKFENTALFSCGTLARISVKDTWFLEIILELEKVDSCDTLARALSNGTWKPENIQLEEIYDPHTGVWRPVTEGILGGEETRLMQHILAQMFGGPITVITPYFSDSRFLELADELLEIFKSIYMFRDTIYI
ncbi:hypothetical protein F4775DRAFT_531496 [Biscogniauxia sp. FL1348]|nr:hypothetical protein F4775DRAFT_531496 [Biscogniauxia sp. FL1348]